MKHHEFILIFKLGDKDEDPRTYADALQSCDKARPSFGIRGYLAVEFEREASSLSEAKRRAVRDVLHIIPDAQLDVLSP